MTDPDPESAALPGLPPGLSRTVDVPGVLADAGAVRRWHLLDTADALAARGAEPVGTVLAVHGNPTWAYLWRTVLAGSLTQAEAGGPAWRVLAVDQLEMGWSERTPLTRSLEQRIADLGALTEALALSGPVVTLGHDWGGVVSLGWATEHPELLAGVMLLNTAVHHPDGVPIPAPLRLAGARGVLQAGSVATTGFLDTTLSLGHPPLPPEVRQAYRSPYRTAARRRGIGAFVADIPADPAHPSHRRLTRLAADVADLDVPAILLWGPRDPIFSDRYLDDLVRRLPHADVHRLEGAGHLVIEDAPVADALFTWLRELPLRRVPGRHRREVAATDAYDLAEFRPLWQGLVDRRGDTSDAVVEVAAGRVRRISWRSLDDRVACLAAGLHRLGVRRGDRVSLLVQPGATLTAVLYACLRIGAVVVVADAGLGVRGLTRAVRGAWPQWIVGEAAGLAAARALGWPGTRISAARLPRASAALLGVRACLADLIAEPPSGRGKSDAERAHLRDPAELPNPPGPGDLAAVLYTSGSTGPAKGVRYTHAQLSALRDILARHFDLGPDSGLVTGFAPFALLGPALGARSSTPEMDVSSPRTLTASAVAAAVEAASADIVFLSPAAILNVVATADRLDESERAALATVRTVLSTGAPVGRPLLVALAEVMPRAEMHAVYGMTECLLVSDITLDEMPEHPGEQEGICVGRPIQDVELRIAPLDEHGRSTGAPTAHPGRMGEIVLSAPHLKAGYDRLWLTDREAERDIPMEGRWHRTGDVGHLDAGGRLWIEGRLPHVITTEDGPVAPVGIEQEIERADAVRRAAVVGVGPEGLRQFVAVIETEPAARRAALADPGTASEVRGATTRRIAAVLAVPTLPTDIRHNSKIDRVLLSRWADRILTGRRVSAP